MPSTTPFPNYEVSSEFKWWLIGIIRRSEGFGTEAEQQRLWALDPAALDYEFQRNQITNRTDVIRDDYLASTPGLTPGLFAILNRSYLEASDIKYVLHAISLRQDLSETQFQSIRRHVLKLLDQPAEEIDQLPATEAFIEQNFLMGAMEVLARHPGADGEDILLRALDRPNDNYVNQNAAKALALMGSSRGRARIRELRDSQPPDSYERRAWQHWLDRYDDEPTSEQKKDEGAAASKSAGSSGSESAAIQPPQPSIKEVRGSALLWLGVLVGFALVAVGWLWWRLRRK